MGTLGSSYGDLQSRISEIHRRRVELDRKLEQKRQSSSVNEDSQNPGLQLPNPSSTPTSPTIARSMSPVGLSLARAKEEYIKQVTKDLPQWLLLKQQKEAEQIADWQKSVGALNDSHFAIKDELAKHTQYMKDLSEKKSELMRQYEEETHEEAMRKHKLSNIHKGIAPDIKPQYNRTVDFGFSHRSAAEFLERTSFIADLYFPSFPKKPHNNLRELLSDPAPSQPASHQSPDRSVRSNPVPPTSAPREAPNSSIPRTQKSEIASQAQDSATVKIPTPELPAQVQSPSPTSQISETESETTPPGKSSGSIRHPRDEELNFSDAAVKIPRPRRDSNPRSSPLRNHITTPAVPKHLRSSLKFESHDGKLDTFKNELQRGKANMVPETDSEVEMGSYNDSKDDEEEEDVSFIAPSPTDFMRIASKESINSRYTANTLTHTTTATESENDITDPSLASFRTDDEESASDDFFISRSNHNSNHKSKNGKAVKPKKETLDDASSASEDFFITVNKGKSSATNGIIAARPGVATSPSRSPSRKSHKQRERSRERAVPDEKRAKGEKKSAKAKRDGTDTEDDLAEDIEDFEDLDELPEFSEVYDSGGETPRTIRTPRVNFAHPDSNSFPATKPANSSNSSISATPRVAHPADSNLLPSKPANSSNSSISTNPRATRPTRVLPMGPSSISLMDAHKSLSPSQSDENLIPGLPKSPSVRNPASAVKASVKFQLSDSPDPSKSNLLDGADYMDPLDIEDQPLHKSPSQSQVNPQRQSKKLLISTHQHEPLPEKGNVEQPEKGSGEQTENKDTKKKKGKKEKPIVNSVALSQSLKNSGTKIEPLDHTKVLRRLVAYIERDPLDEFLYRSRCEAKLVREIKTTADKEPRQLAKYRVKDCCSALLDTIKTFPGGLLSQQFVGYLMKQDSYGEEGLLEFSPPNVCEFWNVLLEHLEVLQARRLMPWNQIITIFGNTLLSGLSHLDLGSKEFSTHARHEALRQFLQKEPDSNMPELEEFLGDSDLSVVLALSSCLESQKNSQDARAEPEDPLLEGISFYLASEEARLALSFVTVWLTYKPAKNGSDELSTGRTWPLVATVLSHEFSAVETRVKFLEGVSFGSALVATYGRVVGRDYFRFILDFVIGMIVRDPASIEIDLLRIKGKNPNDERKILNKNRNHLKTACEMVMEKVTSLDANYPGDLADVFVHVSTLIHEHVGGDIQIANNALRRIFWDYWVCPAIAQPSVVGIYVPETDPSVQRGLGILANSMRAAAMGEPTKVQHIAALTNPFITTFNGIIPMFLNPGPHGRYAPPLVDGLSREGSLKEILALLKIHFNKVIKFLQSQDTISVKLCNFLEFALTDRLKSGKKVRDRMGSMDLSDVPSERKLLERAVSYGVVDGNIDDQYEENIKL
eukprot:Phypoly_transcript_00560.p1 GENE.Phypoly_transcript_00560~~Phypoly_transcript_00560.p1  ORF type:complete len:1396 (+),score=273.29 Phypoly_transcript_00560:123-4310(+)